MSGRTDIEGIIELWFGCSPKDLSKFVVFTAAQRNLDDFKEHCTEVLHEFSGWLGSGFTGETQGRRITVIYPGIGSSQIGDATLAVGYGSCKVAVFIGSVGGLTEGMKIGDIVLVDESVIGEGFSRYHLGKGHSEDAFGQIAKANAVLADHLWPQVCSTARKVEVSAHRGRIFTTESTLAEPERFLQGVVRLGCIGIEKEISAFYTAAGKTKTRAVAVLCISDVPLHGKTLFVTRTAEEEAKRVRTRHEVIPQIVLWLAATPPF